MDPLVEPAMRCRFGTLDHLGGAEGDEAIREALAEVEAIGPEMSDAIARS